MSSTELGQFKHYQDTGKKSLRHSNLKTKKDGSVFYSFFEHLKITNIQTF